MTSKNTTVAAATIAEEDASWLVLSKTFPNIQLNVAKGIASN